IVENGYDETAKIQAVAPQEFEDREKELLVLAKKWLPSLPFKTADILLIDEIGKNISGTGMDTNVVGRKYLDHVAGENEWPKVRTIVIRGLTKETHGNATGIGLAEFALTRAIDAIDIPVTRTNCLTGGHATGAMIPIHYPTDREVLDVSLPIIGLTEPVDAKLMWIHNTLDVAEVECSAAYLDEARTRDDLEIVSELRPLPFDSAGVLPTVARLGT
ncbi:MAG: [Fe-S]-binding protein, partial [Planctomycetales bacterium]|nr:[Fe-S]-binding protein [Planctomycetales bacterium]